MLRTPGRSPWKSWALAVLVLSSAGPASLARGQASASGLIRREEALAHGLHRAWAQQVSLDGRSDALASLTLAGDMLFAQSDGGLIHALDAETGRTLWSTRLGDRRFPTTAPARFQNYVAAANGDDLYMLDAKSGRIWWQRKLPFQPIAPAALDDRRVIVPLLDGTLISYRVDLHELADVVDPIAKSKAILESQPISYRAKGQPAARPLILGELFAWTTLNGRLYVARMHEPGTNFEFRLNESCAAPPTYRKPLLYLTSVDRSVYALEDQHGVERWRYFTGAPIYEPAAVVGDSVVVTTRGAGAFCLDAASGNLRWSYPQGRQFIAASPDRIYLSDGLQQMLILDRATGRLLDRFTLLHLPIRYTNLDNDRIYLARPSGLVQCLRENSLAAAVAVAPPPSDEAAEQDQPRRGRVRDAPVERERPAEGDAEAAGDAEAEGDVGAAGDAGAAGEEP